MGARSPSALIFHRRILFPRRPLRLPGLRCSRRHTGAYSLIIHAFADHPRLRTPTPRCLSHVMPLSLVAINESCGRDIPKIRAHGPRRVRKIRADDDRKREESSERSRPVAPLPRPRLGSARKACPVGLAPRKRRPTTGGMRKREV